MTTSRVVIVGESLAGTTAARELLDHGFDGTVTMIGDEDHLPYQRPPLSKAVLAGQRPWDSVTIAPLPEDRVVRNICSAATLHAEDNAVELADGSRVPYDTLVIATGASPRRVSTSPHEMVLRTVDDARLLRSRLDDASTVIVVGASILGMEVASTCITGGAAVTVVDIAAPLQAVMGDELASHFVSRAVDLGCVFVQSTGAVTLVEHGDKIGSVLLPDGTELSADVVITCAGDIPNIRWLESSPLQIEGGGVIIDEDCRTSVPNILAAGDVTARMDNGRAKRTPFWANAVAQGRVAAATIMGVPLTGTLSAHDPYFWTDQFGLSMSAYGPLPPEGAPHEKHDDFDAGSGRARWNTPQPTGVVLGKKMPLPRLRTWVTTPSPESH